VKVPHPFTLVISALNGEQEFSPHAVTARRLVTLPSGHRAIRTFFPYWVRLRNDAYMWKMAPIAHHVIRSHAAQGGPGLLRAHQELARLERKPMPGIPADTVYQSAQDAFTRTLRNLVEKWVESGRNLRACFERFPGMERKVTSFLRREPLMLLASTSGPSLVAGPIGSLPVQRFPRGKDNPHWHARRQALQVFVELVRHPDCDRLGKCARDVCGRYFFGRPGQKFCPRPRRCGSILAAIEATKNRWKENRREKLRRAQAECRKWEPRMGPWKPWVAAQLYELGITTKWLTRAVNKRDLAPPKETGKQSKLRRKPQ